MKSGKMSVSWIITIDSIGRYKTKRLTRAAYDKIRPALEDKKLDN